VGADSFLAELALEELLQNAVGREREGAVQVLYGDETTWPRVLEAARTGSLFVARRAVVVRRAEALKGDEDALDAYLERPSPDVALVLVAARPDRRKSAWKRLLSRAQLHPAEPKKGRALAGFVAEQLRRRGLRLDQDAQHELIERVGQDLRRLMGELDKLEAFGGVERTLGASDVAAVLGRPLARPLYELADAVTGREAALALERLDDALEAGEEPLLLLGVMHRAVRQVRACLALQRRGASRDELAARLLPKPLAFKLPAMLDAARRWSEPQAGRAIAALAEADRALKRGAEPRAALTAAAVAACAPARPDLS
jgi:DNA polymerase III delta subunit